MPFNTFSRATLFHLILNPLVSIPTRASAAGAIVKFPSQTPHRASAIFYPECPSAHLHQRGSFYSTMPSSNNQDQTQNESSKTGEQDLSTQESPLGLPDPSSAESQATKLDVSDGGSTVKLDHMGPLVVNQDGTLSRISNWEQMTEIEKRNTLRVLGKRNKQRMEALKAAEAEGAQ